MNSQTYFQEELLPHSRPYSMSYAGHQFGNWAGQRRRAIILAEIENKEQVYTLQLKGAGMTPTPPQSRWFSSTAFFYTRAFVQRSHVSSRRSHYPIPSLILTGDQVT
jgi:hypothetical protein